MSVKKQKKNTTENSLDNLNKAKLSFCLQPKSPGQEAAVEAWKRSRVLFLLGPSGTGKSHQALALALHTLLRSKGRGKLLLTKPMVPVGDPIGYLPGSVEEKILPWLGPFYDVYSSMAFGKLEDLEEHLDLEVVPIEMLRGRTVRNGILIVDECQNCSYAQLKCILTRLGENGRIILCGDTDQSDKFNEQYSPLNYVANALIDIDVVSVVRFDGKVDQLRDSVVTDILSRLT